MSVTISCNKCGQSLESKDMIFHQQMGIYQHNNCPSDGFSDDYIKNTLLNNSDPNYALATMLTDIKEGGFGNKVKQRCYVRCLDIWKELYAKEA